VLQNKPAFFSGISIGFIWKFDGSVWVVVLGEFCIKMRAHSYLKKPLRSQHVPLEAAIL